MARSCASHKLLQPLIGQWLTPNLMPFYLYPSLLLAAEIERIAGQEMAALDL